MFFQRRWDGGSWALVQVPAVSKAEHDAEVAGLRQERDEHRREHEAASTAYVLATRARIAAEAERDGLRAQLAEAVAAASVETVESGLADAEERAEVAEGRLAATQALLATERQHIAHEVFDHGGLFDECTRPDCVAVLVSDRDTNEGETCDCGARSDKRGVQHERACSMYLDEDHALGCPTRYGKLSAECSCYHLPPSSPTREDNT